MAVRIYEDVRVMGIRAYKIDGQLWYLLEDIRRYLKKPRLQGVGPAKYKVFHRTSQWPYMKVRLRLVDECTLLRYIRMYGTQPMHIWRRALATEAAAAMP